MSATDRPRAALARSSSWYRRPATAAAVLALAALGVGACGSSSSSSTTTTAAPSSATTAASSSTTGSSSSTTMGSGSGSGSGKNLTFAFVPGVTTDPFYITMHVGASEEAKKLGVKLIWQGGTDFTAASQTPVLQALQAQHPSALLVTPTDAAAMAGPIEAYTKAHIPVISVDTTLNNTSLLDARITSDNTQGGAAAADAIAKLAHDNGQVAVLRTTPGTSTTQLRAQGFINEIKKYPHMSVVADEYDNDSASTAATQVQSILLAHSGVVGIFGTNLASAEGAGTAVSGAGKSGKVFIAGYDAEPKEVQLLEAGTINTLVIQQPAEEGMLAVQYAYDLLTGRTSKVQKSVLLPNVVATTATAKDANVSKYYYVSNFSG